MVTSVVNPLVWRALVTLLTGDRLLDPFTSPFSPLHPYPSLLLHPPCPSPRLVGAESQLIKEQDAAVIPTSSIMHFTSSLYFTG